MSCRWNPSHCFAQPRRQVFISSPHVTTPPLEAQAVVLLLVYLLLPARFLLILSLLGTFFHSSDASRWLSQSPHPFPPDASLLAIKKSGGQCYTKKRTFFFCCAFPTLKGEKEEITYPTLTVSTLIFFGFEKRTDVGCMIRMIRMI